MHFEPLLYFSLTPNMFVDYVQIKGASSRPLMVMVHPFHISHLFLNVK